MNCRNCGAAMQPVGGRAYFRCQYCGTFEFPQTNGDGVASLGEVTKYPCPVCENPLEKAAVQGHTACFCKTCFGFLTTNDEFSGMLGKLRAEYASQPSSPRTFDPIELKRRVHCPKCQRLMDAHPYGGGGGVVIDTCARCRLIWLDAGEMELIARHRSGLTNLYSRVGLLESKSDCSSRQSEPNRGSGWEAPYQTPDISDGITLGDLLRYLF
jgi:Zn-finger nucleic acid-binding protein